ncbi:integrase [Ramlibacter henchirensis]|uniref:Integrase n=1 Tax=Ramlibacter henchirensis TaxID=204072 RepID=A0A4Z0BRC7_9BURK|nr:integrase [Ramlibacter henchirensis]TFZ00960.1 integrase [Ramlibacter henchirensis]
MTVTPGQMIKELQAGQSARLVKIEHGGSLEARRLNSGNVMLYWRHTREGRTERTPIGPWDSAAPPKSTDPTPRGYSITAATVAARGMAKEDAETPGGLRAQREREAAAQAAAAHEKASRERYTLKALCADYVAYLKGKQKASWRDAENIFQNHLQAAFPELAAKPAAQVERREIVEAVRRLTEADKATTARKLRAYVRAAYSCAVRADSDPALPSSFIAYRVTTNPVEGMAAIKSQADKNPLSAAELRRYWKALQEVDGPVGAALRLQVVSGGQRPLQLARLTANDIAGDTLRLLDPKGKRDEPREHFLPITRPMRTELDRLPATGFKLSTDGGTTPMHATSLSAWASEIGAAARIEGFQLKRVRSGIETLLAEAGVSREIRGHLQSHGISGVQAVHYDAHTYLPEKCEALDALYRLLEREPAKNWSRIARKRAA